MLLSKIMLSELASFVSTSSLNSHAHRAADVPSIVSGKLALKYSGRDLDAMQAVAKAALNRSLAEFKGVLASFDKVRTRSGASHR